MSSAGSPVPLVSVVVPVHNEAGFLPTGLPLLLEAVERSGVNAEVILVENGSTDGSADIAEQIGASRVTSRVRVIRLPDADYGNAVREGLIRANADWVVMFDLDYHSSAFLADLHNTVSDGADIVIASKRNRGSEDRRPMLRRLATVVFSTLLHWMLNSKVSDTHGIKAFSRAVIERHVPEVVSRQDLFDTELVIRAEHAGAVIVEVPVIVEELRPARSSLIKRVPRTLRGLSRIRRVLARSAP